MVLDATRPERVSLSPYQFKPSRYSSHMILLSKLPSHGDGRRVLDLGCGEGHLSKILSARGFLVIGVERKATPNFPPEVELVQADLDRGLPPLPGGFDFILCGDVLEHLRDPLSTLLELRLLLNPGGRLVASLPNSGHAYFRLTVLVGRFPAHDRGLFDRTHVRFYTWDGWRVLLHDAGFEVEQVAPTGTPIGLAFPRSEGSAAVRWLEWLSFKAARFWMRLFAYQFVVVARSK